MSDRACPAYPRLGLEYLAWAVLLVALYLLLVRTLALPSMRARIGAWAALLAFMVGLSYLATVVIAWMDWWGLVGHVKVPMLRPAYASLILGGPNVVAPVMVLSDGRGVGRPASASSDLRRSPGSCWQG